MMKNNFFMMVVFGVMALLGTSFELHSSEKISLAPYVVGGTVLAISASVFAVTQTATYQTYSADQARRVEEQEKSDNLLLAEPLLRKRSSSETLVMSAKAQAYLKSNETERREYAQKFATKKTERTLPSHIIDNYAGEYRK